MKIIKQRYLIKAPVVRVWKALTDQKDIEGWGAGPAKMDDKKNTQFEIWGGDIRGKNIEVIPNKNLVQEWQYKGWEKPSKVTFSLRQKDEVTELELLHEDVPNSESEDIEQGWKDYYLGPLKDFVENQNAR